MSVKPTPLKKWLLQGTVKSRQGWASKPTELAFLHSRSLVRTKPTNPAHVSPLQQQNFSTLFHITHVEKIILFSHFPRFIFA